FTPVESQALFQALLPFPLHYLPQRGNGLGERLVNIFADSLDAGFRKIVIMDSDSPTLPTAYVREAFAALSDPGTDAVFGPCSDGGYYLVGARTLHTGLFQDITWSTPAVLAETLAQARLHHLNVTLLPAWYDIDNSTDLHKLAVELGRLDGNAGV